MTRALLAALCLLVAGCMTDEPSARRALDAAGYTDIRFTGYDWWACSDDDGVHTGFTATSVNGHRVSGAVCCGYFFKNCTIRTE